MRFCKSFVIVLLGIGCAVAARAQAGVYVGFQATELRGMTCFDPQGQCSSVGGQVNPQGFEAGAYYDFRNVGPMRLGVDFRGGTQHSNKSATSSGGGADTTVFNNVLLGVRGSFHTRYSWMNPYVQVSAGYAKSNATLPFGAIAPGSVVPNPPRLEDNFVVYEGLTGFNIHIFPMIDLRPIELGLGNMNRIGSGGTVDGPASILLMSIGASVVFHMPTSR